MSRACPRPAVLPVEAAQSAGCTHSGDVFPGGCWRAVAEKGFLWVRVWWMGRTAGAAWLSEAAAEPLGGRTAPRPFFFPPPPFFFSFSFLLFFLSVSRSSTPSPPRPLSTRGRCSGKAALYPHPSSRLHRGPAAGTGRPQDGGARTAASSGGRLRLGRTSAPRPLLPRGAGALHPLSGARRPGGGPAGGRGGAAASSGRRGAEHRHGEG